MEGGSRSTSPVTEEITAAAATSLAFRTQLKQINWICNRGFIIFPGDQDCLIGTLVADAAKRRTES
ncbi:hypothetical protein EJB05_15418, partial [Eragrostis curvula]